jgi:KaiC/GvpD/RAD55 family RecA-like ATPase
MRCPRGFDGYLERVIHLCRSSEEAEVAAYRGFGDAEPVEAPRPEGDGSSATSNTATDEQPATNNSDNARASTGPKPLIQTSAQFVADFVPPDYLIDGLMQKSFLYSLTGPTGSGKTTVALRLASHVAYGLLLANRAVEQGKVLFFAGENPDDVRMRWVKLAEEMQIDQNTTYRIFWCTGSLKFSDVFLRNRITEETNRHGPFALIIVDTSAAFFEGDDENNNAQMANHARMFRRMMYLSGAPAILVTAHPTKNANLDWLVPRGGGAFVNEMDGNLVCIKQPDSMVVELHWQVKLRGPDFAPIPFKLTPGTSERLKDSKGRKLWTVTAAPITDQQQAEADAAVRTRQDQLLAVIANNPNLGSIADLARAAGWFYADGTPNKTNAHRTVQALKAAGLVKQERGQWVLTRAGRAAAGTAPRFSETML